ncbi:MAG: C4-dicarboxylate ABC transporter [Deltaproteobacteria bacterium CG_4_9_14_3_um_filter_44_9]|nr:MAG: C4-dicarboxylate ABC transporter [Deltaproteobacteria bacterium CG06_land_8_20_14_3_00_44_19]PIZ18949.1 MAG: C4-dicarboxylate ABC transporter [Deltaproteobacteria bacterium CG_4_10_14_0_8_um_filter_43_12]PJB44294.1 MAG: C4-dicarboxylate ABC transporter [Deltaproteobacteria bacterium CG_4_9_14_3_um_filter_44_9]HCX90130.1 C4-dicarboxylate ABC transporter [Deltaproteobacteria bacterium]
MKKFGLILMVLIVSLALATISPFAMAEEERVLLKIPVAFPTSLPTLGAVLPWFAKNVEAASGGSIKCIIYEPGKLVPPFEIHDAVSTGKVNAGYTVTGYIVGKVPSIELFGSVPFGPGPLAYLAWFYEGNGRALFQETFDNAGYNFKVFPFGFIGPETGGWFTKPIEKPKDLKGLRIRFFGLGGKVMQKVGASVSLIPGGEIFPALEKRAIEGTEFSQPAMDAKLGFSKVCKYNYFPGWHQPASQAELIINKDTWNSMSPRQQTIIELAVRAANSYTLANSEAIQGKIIKENAKKHGVHNLYWSDKMLEVLKKAWLEVVREMSAKDPMFKKTWDDLQTFMVEHDYWEVFGYLPRPPRPKK